MPNFQVKLQQASQVVIKDCMRVAKGEKVLIVVDTPLRTIGQGFLEAAVEAQAEAVYLEMLTRANHGEEPPASVAQAMLEADVILLATSKSLTHTQARKKANLTARIASLPGLNEEVVARTLSSSYENIAELCEKTAAKLTKAQQVRITTPLGTDLTFSIADRTGVADTGLLTKKGDFGNLPAGEAYIAPVEGTAQGVLVIDASMSALGLLETPLILKVEAGQAVEITGGKAAQELNAIMEKYGSKARNIAELGIGTNDKALITGAIIEDEKKLGTIHIALGDNSTFGGTVEVDSHLDGIILNPTVYLDEEIFIENGRFLVDK